MRIKWLGATLAPPVSASLPNQTQRLPVISSYYLACRRSPRVVKIYSNLPCGCGSLIVEVNIPRRDDSERRSTLGADPAPISFLVSFLHDGTQPERERERDRQEEGRKTKKKKKEERVILRMEMATLKEALENGPSPTVVSLETRASKELRAATAKDTNDPMTLGKGCWSVNLALDDPSYVGQNE